MPQLDFYSYNLQYFWLTIFFFLFYYLIFNIIIIRIFKILKLRFFIIDIVNNSKFILKEIFFFFIFINLNILKNFINLKQISYNKNLIFLKILND